MTSRIISQLIILYFLLGIVESCSDFVFLVDTEIDDSPLGRGLQRRRDLVLKAAEQLDLSTGLHRVALIIYGKRPSDELLAGSFDDFATTDEFVQVLKSEFDALLLRNETRRLLPSIGSADALEILLKRVLSKKRMNSPVVVLAFTDGRIRPNEAARLERISAQLSKKHYIHTFAINPEGSISVERLATLELLTNGDKKAIVTSQNRQISAEQKMNDILAPFLSCQKFSKSRILRRKPKVATTAAPRQVDPECLIDVVLLMDFSGGAVDKREKYLNLGAELIKDVKLGPDAVQVAFVRFSGPKRTDTVFHLKKHQNAKNAVFEMLATPSLGGTTRIGAAMLDAFREFDAKFGGRSTAQKVMIVFTDGFSQDDPTDAAVKLYQENIRLFSVAVEDHNLPADFDNLKAIATNLLKMARKLNCVQTRKKGTPGI
uniref:VWFA domain-containing protein n=1 Tax=Panagrolaimus sp. JU765 TaxID=591449 RepID=A0AC34PY10_9BILA